MPPARALPSSRPDYIKRNIPLYEPFSDDQLELIENNADIVLQEIGIDFRDDPEALGMWKEAGADVKGDRVRFPKGLVRSLLKTAPREFTQFARNPANNVMVGGKNTVFAPVYGPPFVYNIDEGRRYATIEDFRNFVKLAYMSPSLHHSGGTVCEPVDIPVAKRHLDMVYSHIRYSDKPFMGSVTAPERAEDSVTMAKMVFGDDFVDQNCVMINLINANSPLVFDGTMVGALKVYARNNQATVISPFILSGAMSAVTAVGTLTQILAEASVGMAFAQLCRPGAPVVFGTFASSISMQSGAPTFGTPEPAFVLFGAAQLARRLGVPFRSGGGLCASKLPDAQAAHESANTLWPTLHGRGQFRACMRRAGSKAVSLRVMRSSSSMPTSSPCSSASPKASISRRTARRSMPFAKSARARISSAAPIRRPISRRPSGARASPITIPTSSGAMPAARTPARARTTRGSDCCASMRRRRSIPPSMNRCRPSWQSARKRCPTA